MNAVTSVLAGFRSRSEKQRFIDGEWRNGQSGERLGTYNPAVSKVFATRVRRTQADVDAAVASAGAPFEWLWIRFTPPDRQALLPEIANAVGKNFDELVVIESMAMAGRAAATTSMDSFSRRP